MIHDSLGAALHHGFRGREGDELADEVEDDDERKVIRGKMYRARMFGTDQDRKEDLLNLLWTSTPLDHLWRLVQHVDEKGLSLYSLLSEDTNPFSRAGRLSVDIITRQGGGSDINVLLHHIAAHDAVKRRRVLTKFVDDVLEMNAHTWFRLARRYHRRPFRNLKLTDDRFSFQERLREAQMAFDANECCIDEPYTIKMRRKWAGPYDLITNKQFKNMQDNWGRSGRMSNMHTERLLALFKAACPGKVPNAEKFCHAGFVTQVLYQYVLLGAASYSATHQLDI
jgi:hypothetical protein